MSVVCRNGNLYEGIMVRGQGGNSPGARARRLVWMGEERARGVITPRARAHSS